MATFPGRAGTLKAVVDTLYPQLDDLYVYLNGYTEIPAWMAPYEHLHPVLGKDAYGDLNANGKMIFLEYEQPDAIAFTLDDDILYPPDYVARMVACIEAHDRRVSVAVHGSIIPDTASWYYERTFVFGARKKIDEIKAANLVGSGTFAFPLDGVPLRFDDFRGDVFVDLSLSLAALDNGIPLTIMQREADWISFIKYEGLWEKFKTGVTHHTHIMRASDSWLSQNVAEVWRSFLLRRSEDWEDYCRRWNLDYDFCYYAMGGPIPELWRVSRVSLEKALIFADESFRQTRNPIIK